MKKTGCAMLLAVLFLCLLFACGGETPAAAPSPSPEPTKEAAIPTEESTRVSGPIAVSANTVLRVRTFAPGNASYPSDTKSYTYVIVNGEQTIQAHDTTLPVVFDTEAKARDFCGRYGRGSFLPIDTGKHIYTHWTAILEKRGALHPRMDPFRHPDNAPFVPDYLHEDHPRTLDLLSRTTYLLIDPDWTEEKIDEIAKAL